MQEILLNPAFASQFIFLIPLFPLIGAVLNLLLGARLGKRFVGRLGCAVVLLSFITSVWMFLNLLSLPPDLRILTNQVFTWVQVGHFRADVAFLIDPLSAVMMLVVSGVGFLIHIYSLGYMAHDARFTRYFGYLNLFVFAMLTLVLGDNLLLMFLGWEGVGLCSYLLIGFWFEKKENAIAGMKAFVVNRIGDFGFTMGMIILFLAMGQYAGVWSIKFTEIEQHISVLKDAPGILGMGLATVIGILLFTGAVGKSAQIPLYVWLPDAMAGPTPVSALIHAATMVTAGVYMVARMNFLFEITPTAIGVVATVGALTALFSATIALVQNDIKRILAYSTVSQLGYMFLGVGVGAYAAGIFHLMTHAFFKALLFLGAGSVIHGMGGEQDIRRMGGLRKYMPITYVTFIIATLAIAGIPPFAGFFSKDKILWMTFVRMDWHVALWAIGTVGAGLTAFYMGRLTFKTFFGECRADEHTKHHIHESPPAMTVPLIILAVLSLIGGFVGIPHVLGGGNHIKSFMDPVFKRGTYAQRHDDAVSKLQSPSAQDEYASANRQSEYASQKSNGQNPKPHGAEHRDQAILEIALMVLSAGIGLAGLAIAFMMYIRNPEIPVKLGEKFRTAYTLLLNKYYVDEIYNVLVVRNLLRLNRLLAAFDLKVIDGIVNGAARLTEVWSAIVGWFDLVFIDGAVNGLARIVTAIGENMRKIQTGQVQTYIAWGLGGAVLLVLGAIVFL